MNSPLRRLATLSQSRGLRQSAGVLIGNTASMSISALAMILVSRILGPEKFGEFSIGFSLALILNRVTDLGLSNAVQKYGARSNDQAGINRLFSYTTRLKLGAILVVAVVGLFAHRLISSWLNFDSPMIVLLAFTLSSCAVLYEHLQAMLQSLHLFSKLVVINIMQSTAKLIGIVVLATTSLTATSGFLVWYLVAPLLPVLIWRQFLPAWVTFSVKGEFKAERQLIRSMASHSAVAFIAAGLVENLDVLFVQGYLSTYEAGLLSGASKIAMLFTLIAYSLGNVLNARVAKYHSKAHLRSYFKKAWAVVAASCLGFVATAVSAKWLIILTIGAEYLPGLPLLVGLLGAAFLTIAVIPFIAVFFSFEAPWYFSVSGLLQLALTIGGNFWLLPIYGLQATVWTRLVTRGILFLGTVIVAWWYYRQLTDESVHAT